MTLPKLRDVTHQLSKWDRNQGNLLQSERLASTGKNCWGTKGMSPWRGYDWKEVGCQIVQHSNFICLLDSITIWIPDKWGPPCFLMYWSGIQMVGLVHRAWHINEPFEIWILKSLVFKRFQYVFKCFWYSNGWCSYPHCILKNCCISLSCLPSGLHIYFEASWSFPFERFPRSNIDNTASEAVTAFAWRNEGN